MAKTHTATVEFACWKEHTCVGCGSTFRYLFKQQGVGTGPTEQAAGEAARRAAARSLQKEIGMEPCPSCGTYQPDMVGDAEAGFHSLLLVVVALALGVLVVLGACNYLSLSLVTWIAVGLCALAALGHFRLARSNPNRDLEANRQEARKAVEAKTLLLETPGQPGSPPPQARPKTFGVGHWLAFLLLSLGIVALAAPEALRLACGWPLNRDCYPMVVGPGDAPYIYFPDEVTSLKGLWNGEATAEVLNARELGLTDARLPADGQHDHWGSIMFGKRVRAKTARLWASVAIPETEELVHKNMKIRINLNIKYPAESGAFGFREERQVFAHRWSCCRASC
jgi:hypothetical protein